MLLSGIIFVSLNYQSKRKTMFKKTDSNPQLDMFTAPSVQLCSRASKKYSDPNAWHNQFYSLVTTKIDEDIFKPLCSLEARRLLPFMWKQLYLQTVIFFKRRWKTVNMSRILQLKSCMLMVPIKVPTIESLRRTKPRIGCDPFRIIGKISALTILQYVNFINDKPIGRIKYALN